MHNGMRPFHRWMNPCDLKDCLLEDGWIGGNRSEPSSTNRTETVICCVRLWFVCLLKAFIQLCFGFCFRFFLTMYYPNLYALVQCVCKTNNCNDHNYPPSLQALILMSKLTIMWSNVVWKHLICVFANRSIELGSLQQTFLLFHVWMCM